MTARLASRLEVAKAMLFCLEEDGYDITKSNMKKKIPITEKMWKEYTKHHKDKAVKSVIWHIVGQLIRVRDDWEEALEVQDKKAAKIARKKTAHYTRTVYVYLATGVRPEEK